MKITKTQTITTDNPSDAVKIEVGDITILVNRHTGSVTVDGADHVHASEGEHNTLEVLACSHSVEEAAAINLINGVLGLRRRSTSGEVRPDDFKAKLGKIALDAFNRMDDGVAERLFGESSDKPYSFYPFADSDYPWFMPRH